MFICQTMLFFCQSFDREKDITSIRIPSLELVIHFPSSKDFKSFTMNVLMSNLLSLLDFKLISITGAGILSI